MTTVLGVTTGLYWQSFYAVVSGFVRSVHVKEGNRRTWSIIERFTLVFWTGPYPHVVTTDWGHWVRRTKSFLVGWKIIIVIFVTVINCKTLVHKRPEVRPTKCRLYRKLRVLLEYFIQYNRGNMSIYLTSTLFTLLNGFRHVDQTHGGLPKE